MFEQGLNARVAFCMDVIMIGMDDTPCTYRVSVKAAIEDEQGRILLLRGPDDCWELPGGGQEHGEDSREALVREVHEETGLTVDWMDERPEAYWTIQRKDSPTSLRWYAFVVFKAKVSGTIQLQPDGDEALEARYFSRDEAKALQLHDNSTRFFL